MGRERSSTASPAELIRALAIFAEPPSPNHARVAEALGLGASPDGEEYAGLFSFQLYPYASVYLGAEGMRGGEAADRVAGFWRALGYAPPGEPDHLSALLGLYATLRETEHAGGPAERELAGRSAAALLHEHLSPWVFSFLDRVGSLGGPFHRAWAALLGELLEREVAARRPLESLPLHLRDAPLLPDPRDSGSGPFLSALLAPVCSGMILCRADLTRIGRARDLGLRLGERRFVLEHLLGQDPGGTLEALAREAEAWTARHAQRADRLGATGAFWLDRSKRAHSLLCELMRAEPGTAAAAPAPAP